MRSENQREFQTAQYAKMCMICYLQVIRLVKLFFFCCYTEEFSGLPHDDFLHEKCILALEMWKDYKGGTFSLSTSVPHESLQIYSRMSTLDLLLEPVLKQLFFQQYLVKYNEG